MKRKVIVTGGAGFIGSHLVEYLVKKKFNVVVIDNLKTGRKKNLKNIYKKIRFVRCDISNYKKIEKIFSKSTFVFHLAGLADIVPSIDYPEDYFKANVEGTLNVLKACKQHKIKKIIYAASASCYGTTNNLPTRTDEKISNEYPYALTKNFGEQLVTHWSKVYKLNYVSLRLFNVYGLRSRTTGAYGAMFGVFLAQLLNNFPLTVVGNGKQTRDFIYVTDVVEAFYKAAVSKVNNKIFNVGSGRQTSVNEIVKLMKAKKINIPYRPGEPLKSQAYIKDTKKYLKWNSKITIKKGVSILIKNIHDWYDAPIWTKKLIRIQTQKWFKYLKKS